MKLGKKKEGRPPLGKNQYFVISYYATGSYARVCLSVLSQPFFLLSLYVHRKEEILLKKVIIRPICSISTLMV